MIKIGGQAIPGRAVLLAGGESLFIFLALLAATFVHLPTPGSRSIGEVQPGSIWGIILFVLVFELSLYFNDLYDLAVNKSRVRLSSQLLRSTGIVLVVAAVASRIDVSLSPGRGTAVLAVPVIIVVMIVWRIILKSAEFPRGGERVLLAGYGSVGLKLAGELQNTPSLRCNIVGLLGEDDDQTKDSDPLPLLGTIRDLERVVTTHRIDRVIVSLKERRGSMPTRELMRLKFKGIQIEDPYSLYERITGRIILENLTPSWLIFSTGFQKSRLFRYVKCAIDLMIALTGLILSAPIFLCVAIAILVEDGFPILYTQERVGMNGRHFKILKFRSMRQTPPSAVPSWTGDHDPRITRVGRVIRKFRFDELPQFINVLRRDMSVIGPRPEQPYFCKMLEEKVPYFGYRHSVRPGITGWAQIKYGYGSSVEDAWRKVELDLFYIKHLSFVLDLAIMIETAKVVLFGRGAR